MKYRDFIGQAIFLLLAAAILYVWQATSWHPGPTPAIFAQYPATPDYDTGPGYSGPGYSGPGYSGPGYSGPGYSSPYSGPYSSPYGGPYFGPFYAYPGPIGGCTENCVYPATSTYPGPSYGGYPYPETGYGGYPEPAGGTYAIPSDEYDSPGPGYTYPTPYGYPSPTYSGYPAPTYSGYPYPYPSPGYGYPGPSYGGYPAPSYSSYPVPTYLYPLPAGIRGDIYAFGPITNLTVFGPSVVTTGDSNTSGIFTCDPAAQVWCVGNYTPQLVSTWKSVMDTNLNRLLGERAKQLTGGVPTLINPNNRLGGEVWKTSGGLTVGSGGVNVTGRGTIIVESGDLVIDGSITASEPIGFVVRTGNIIVNAGAATLRNVYFYAPGTSVSGGNINFTGSSADLALDATGGVSFIARSFSFTTRDFAFTYSTKVALQPPPGFISFILPTILERAP